MCDSFILFISLSGVKKLGSLTQGRYTWRNNQVLKCLAAALESCRTSVNSLPPPSSCWKPTPFVREGKGQASLTTVRPDWSAGLSTGLEDAGRPGHETLLPSWDRIHQPATRPFVLWSASLKLVYSIKLTVPWEGPVEEAYEWKKVRDAELAADAQQQGWKAKVCLVEVGCRLQLGYLER